MKISATIRVQSHSREEAEASAQKIEIDVQQTGDGVQVRTVFPDEGKWFNLGKRTSYSVNYDVAIPATRRSSFATALAASLPAAFAQERMSRTIMAR